jgi:hypothetical protein
MKDMTPQVGDLCCPHNLLRSGEIIVADRDLASQRFCLEADNLMLVVSDEPRRRRTEQVICELLQVMRDSLRVDPSLVTVHQILVASGPRAGQFGYVPSFWIRLVYRP